MKRNVKISTAKFLAYSMMLSGGITGGSVDLAKDFGSSAISSMASIFEPMVVYGAVETVTVGDFKLKFNTSTGEITGYVSGEGHLEIPEKINGVTVKSIGGSAFKNCKNIRYVTIPEGMTELGGCAFHGCTNLEAVFIAGSVTDISYSFCICHNLENVYYGRGKSEWDNISISDLSISNTPSSSSEYYGHYLRGEPYNKFLFSATKYFNSTGINSSSISSSTINWYDVDGVTGGQIQFDTSTGLIVGAGSGITQLHIPDKINGVAVQGFAEGVFKDCILLTSVKIPYGISYLPANIFNGCIKLGYIYLPNTIINIGASAFHGVSTSIKVDFSGSLWDWTNNIVIGTGNSILTSNNNNITCTIIYDKTYTISSIYTNAFYNGKLEGITSGTCTIVSGNLPPGIGLYANGLLYGIPTKSGTYTFIVKNGDKYYQYTITIKAPTAQVLLETNKYEITTLLPTIVLNTENYSFVVDRDLIYFNCLYINGIRLVKGVDYSISGIIDTKITLYADTLSRLPQGENIVTTVFNTTNTGSSGLTSNVTGSSGNYGSENTGSSSQLFDKESEQDMSSAMPFIDVKTSDWYYSALEYLYKLGIMNGKTDTTFAPTDNLTRAELVLTLYRIDGSKVTAQNSFTDVKTSDWYAEAVSWAKNNSIVNGTTDGSTFSPNDPITKEDMATIINRYCSYKGIQIPLGTSGVVADINAVADYAKGHVNTMYQGGILNTDEDNNFNPKVSTSRADVAYILANFLLKY